VVYWIVLLMQKMNNITTSYDWYGKTARDQVDLFSLVILLNQELTMILLRSIGD